MKTRFTSIFLLVTVPPALLEKIVSFIDILERSFSLLTVYIFVAGSYSVS